MLERRAGGKHSSFLQTFVNYGYNKFDYMGPCGLDYKHCYAPSIVVITIVRYITICSLLYDRNYGASMAKTRLLARLWLDY